MLFHNLEIIMEKFEIIVTPPAPVSLVDAAAPDVLNPAFPSAADSILDALGCVAPASIIYLP
jgi:hypothetical protein